MKKIPVNYRQTNASILLRKLVLTTLFAFLLTLIFGAFAFAQDEDDFAPPVKVVPKAEVEELTGQPDIKNRTRMSLTLMDNHLVAAEKFTAVNDGKAAFRELGVFEALITDTLDFLAKSDPDKGKTLDAFKKLEMGLRPFMARLESIRRDLPLGCDEYMRAVMHGLRDARAKAVDPLFSDSVVRVKSDN